MLLKEQADRWLAKWLSIDKLIIVFFSIYVSPTNGKYLPLLNYLVCKNCQISYDLEICLLIGTFGLFLLASMNNGIMIIRCEVMIGGFISINKLAAQKKKAKPKNNSSFLPLKYSFNIIYVKYVVRFFFGITYYHAVLN